MIEAVQINKFYGSDHVLKDVSVRIGCRDKIGIVGRNGAGKTTLIKILTGEDTDFHGKVFRTEHETVAFVAQFFPVQDMNALEYMIAPYLQMRQTLALLEDQMATAQERELEKLLIQYGDLRSVYDTQKGDGAEQRAITFLENIGLAKCAQSPLSVLSGGERNVLAMGRALVQRADVLILDEPGNHLDIKGLAWLESFIREYPGAVAVVSHNRYLLDRVCTSIIEVDCGTARIYTGNYSAYRLERLRTSVAGEMTYNADQKKIARLESVVARFADIARRTADPAWGRRLRARRTHLEKVKEMARDKPGNPVASFDVSFTQNVSKADIALKVSDFNCGFGERNLVSDVSLLIRTGERVALVGENGCGKTTMIKEILRCSAEQNPTVYIGPSLKIAYCSQYGETLHKDVSVFAECMAAGVKTEDEAFKTLSRFLFTRASLEQKIGSLSGGELNRLQLALAVLQGADFLILDEPTNHLDIPSCEAIEDALVDFEGTILAVSHDRYFLDRVATRVLEIADGKLSSWDGNFSEFWYTRYGGAVLRPVKTAATKETATPVEERIIALEAERKTIEISMEDAYTRGDLVKARNIGIKLERVIREIDRLYDEWI